MFSKTWPELVVCRINFPHSEGGKNTVTKEVQRKYLNREKYIGVADQPWKIAQY